MKLLISESAVSYSWTQKYWLAQEPKWKETTDKIKVNFVDEIVWDISETEIVQYMSGYG
jgi:hypothetical protein